MYLDRQVKALVEDQRLNLSRWLNENLPLYLSVETPEQIQEKMDSAAATLKLWEKRKKQLLERRSAERKEFKEFNVVLEDLKRAYVMRRNQRVARENDLGWITSPKNLGHCRELGKDPEEVLKIMGEWYDSVQTSQD